MPIVDRFLCWAGLLSSAALVGLWLTLVAGGQPPRLAGQAAAVVAALGWVAFAGRRLSRRLSAGAAPRRRALALLAVLGLGAGVSFAGLDYGVANRYNHDEGIYTKHASDINNGQPFPTTFIYPHLMFYLDAFAIWVASLFAPSLVALAQRLYGLGDWELVARLVPRALTASLASLAVWPTFRIAERFGGLRAGWLAGALLALSPLWCDGAHNSTNDVPAACFATLCLMHVAGLLEGGRLSGYLLAGACSGLAAASKYPAGLVALAIVAVWLRSAWLTRRPSLDLLWAGLVSLACFLLFMPALFVNTAVALSDDPDSQLFAGLALYTGSGAWLGVTADNNVLYYAGELLRNFGAPALLLGGIGLALGGAQRLRQSLWMAVFPAIFFATVSAMRIVVERNLYPIIPILAALLGLGADALFARLAGLRSASLRQAATGALAAALLALPVVRGLAQAVRYSRPDTRELALSWIVDNVPLGSVIVKEAYTPYLPKDRYAVWDLGRYAVLREIGVVAAPDHDFLILSSLAYGRFFSDRIDSADARSARAAYERLFATQPLRQEFSPSWHTQGPLLSLRRLVPLDLVHLEGRQWSAAEAYVSSSRMLAHGVISYQHPQHWSLFKGWFQPGRYRFELGEAMVAPGFVDVMDLDNVALATLPIDASGSVELELPRADKFLLYVRGGVGSRIERATLRRLESVGSETASAPPP